MIVASSYTDDLQASLVVPRGGGGGVETRGGTRDEQRECLSQPRSKALSPLGVPCTEEARKAKGRKILRMRGCVFVCLVQWKRCL